MSQAVAVAEPVDGGKRGELFGGALTDEALDSSRGVLGTTRNGDIRGLQQFYTPPEAAEFIKQAIDPLGRVPVLDPTAGNGALLAPWPSDQRFGVEVDGDQVEAGDYHAITGDLQRVFPMLRKLGVQFPQIVANPPFGLPWTDGAGRAENSTVAVWRMSLALLAPEGVGAFICGRDRFRREVLSREDAAAVFATVECEDLFDGVDLPCLIAFFVGPDDRSDDGGLLVEAEASREELAERALSHEIKRALCDTGHFYTGSLSYPRIGPMEPWRLVARELERRRREEASQRPTYSVELRGRDRLAIRPGPFVRQALAKAGRLKLIETLHNQPVGHFALNALDWRLLGELEQECDLTIAPAVREAVAQVASAAEREVIPLYEVRPQMRLGYLTDLDSILCTRSDPERGFQEGTRYPLRTDSRINVTSGERVTRNKQGEPIVRKYEEEAKVLVIQVGDKEFCESTEDIEYLLEHFEIPNPGDIATRFPRRSSATVNPRKRAVVMRDFRHGSLQVLLCGIPAIRLGHNLDTASVVVVDGLVFSYEMFDQFIARAHRLSSKKPVTVYVMLTKGSLDEKKWKLLSAKAAAADLALDGQLMDEREEPISMEQVLKELQAKGVPLTGEEIAETELQAAWETTAKVIPFVPRRKPVAPIQPLGETEQLELFAA